ncbi:MAG: hypothetical protein EHM41_11835, partial [Chloroflexi bacterium]
MAENQRWYKGNLHMHSFWSDGVGFPEVGARWFKERGYQFIAFTEHDQHQTGEHWVSVGDLQERGKEFQEIPTLRLYKELFCDSWVEVREDSLGQQVCLKPLYEYRHLLEEPEKFLILNGEEISVSSPQSPHWINVINAPVVILPQKSPESVADAVEQTIKAVEHGSQDSGRPVLVYFNHPNFLWNATAEELAAARSLRFVEIHTALEDCHT